MIFGANFTFDGHDRTFWVGLALSGVAAGASAVWNGVVQPLLTGVTVKDDGDP